MNDDDLALRCHTPPEQVKYANMLFWGSWMGILVMTLTYVLYLTGILEPYVPLQDVPKYWSLPVHEYVEQAKVPIGWGWAKLLGKSDFLNFAGMALLALMTVICFLLTLLPAYVKQKQWVYSTIVLLEVLVLCLAASGILGGGGH